MICTIELDDGRRVDAYFGTSERVPFGARVVFEGEDGELLEGIRVPEISNASAIVCRDTAFSTTQAPKWDPLAPHHLPNGNAAFANRKEAQEYVAKVNDRNDRAGNGIRAGLE